MKLYLCLVKVHKNHSIKAILYEKYHLAIEFKLNSRHFGISFPDKFDSKFYKLIKSALKMAGYKPNFEIKENLEL